MTGDVPGKASACPSARLSSARMPLDMNDITFKLLKLKSEILRKQLRKIL
jgi:hypothetical protein